LASFGLENDGFRIVEFEDGVDVFFFDIVESLRQVEFENIDKIYYFGEDSLFGKRWSYRRYKFGKMKGIHIHIATNK
jgi:hypothetical protein